MMKSYTSLSFLQRKLNMVFGLMDSPISARALRYKSDETDKETIEIEFNSDRRVGNTFYKVLINYKGEQALREDFNITIVTRLGSLGSLGDDVVTPVNYYYELPNAVIMNGDMLRLAQAIKQVCELHLEDVDYSRSFAEHPIKSAEN